MGPLRAFHNDPAIKAFYLARTRAHRQADQIRHGYYWEDGKGCAVGCTLHSSVHRAYEEELGIPQILARLEDSIFEGLQSPEDLWWPERFLDAIPVGADLSLVWPQFAIRLLSDAAHGVLQYAQQAHHTRQRKAIESIVMLYQQWVSTAIQPAAAAADAAAAAADAADAAAYDDAAAAYAAYAAAYAAAAYAVYAAADAADAAAYDDAAAAAADAAAYAAYAAAADAAAAAAVDAAAADAAARKHARQWQAETLVALLRLTCSPA